MLHSYFNNQGNALNRLDRGKHVMDNGGILHRWPTNEEYFNLCPSINNKAYCNLQYSHKYINEYMDLLLTSSITPYFRRVLFLVFIRREIFHLWDIKGSFIRRYN